MINSNAALKYWLIFFGLFLLAGFTVEQSFVLGGLAAIAGGFIVKWWGIKEEKPKPAPAPEAKTPQFFGKLPSGFLNRFSIGKRQVQQPQQGKGGLFSLFSYRKNKK
ncbi:MAG: hypothetical protein VKK04_17330 [Synechococcales bacterium]|nr:hypothetical protein [Synechococcales bacterium]